jgi:hypothetical protein
MVPLIWKTTMMMKKLKELKKRSRKKKKLQATSSKGRKTKENLCETN